MADLRKVRKVLDYVPAKQLRGTRDVYLEALDRRLHREVLVERPFAKPARDEAVRVVPPEEWEAARRAREEQMLRETELDQARGELERVLAREEELRREVDELRARLGPMVTEAAQKRRVALQLLGVRRSAPEGALAPPGPAGAEPEPVAEGGWEVVSEEDILEPPAEEPAPAPAPVTPPDAEVVARVEKEAQAAEDAIRRVEQEISKIETELQSLASQEAGLRQRSAYEHKGYTLYRRTVGKGEKARDVYFFSKATPKTGRPSPLPSGYEVVDKKGRLPLLKKTARKRA